MRKILLRFIKTLNFVFATLDMYECTHSRVSNWTTYHAETNTAVMNQCNLAVGKNQWLAAIS